ncbi:MAG: VOC family protein [Armatimonadetes bacterium]|nr:VOC family protein [Armatimonadota bacterium]
MKSPLEFRNVVRYVADLDASQPLYEALGFRPVKRLEGMLRLTNAHGVQLVLHRWEDPRSPSPVDTTLGFTVLGPLEEARRYVEAAGFRCLREPGQGDVGHFYIYGDLDDNPVVLICSPDSKPQQEGQTAD